MRKVRLKPRERVSNHLATAGFDAYADDITFTQGGRWKEWHDILECWRVMAYDSSGGQVEITGADTLTECAKGIHLQKNEGRSDFYGDWVCYSKKQFEKVLSAS